MIVTSFGEILKLIRNFKGYSLREVANMTGLSHSYIAQIETVSAKTGKPMSPTMDSFTKLSSAYGVDPSDFTKAYYDMENFGELRFFGESIDMSSEDDILAYFKYGRIYEHHKIDFAEKLNQLQLEFDVYFDTGTRIEIKGKLIPESMQAYINFKIQELIDDIEDKV